MDGWIDDWMDDRSSLPFRGQTGRKEPKKEGRKGSIRLERCTAGPGWLRLRSQAAWMTEIHSIQ